MAGNTSHAVITRSAISKKKRRAFLNALATTGEVMTSAKMAGYTNNTFLHQLRREDEDFAAEWADAADAAGDLLLDEARRRAHDGVMEPVFYKGAVVGHKMAYSDTLLMFILRGLRPEVFRDTQVGGGNTNINFGVAVLPMTAPDAKDWETRAIDMHSGQKTITLEAKPIENAMTGMKRSD